MATETFSIAFDDQVSGPANKAASSVDQLKAAASAAAKEAQKMSDGFGDSLKDKLGSVNKLLGGLGDSSGLSNLKGMLGKIGGAVAPALSVKNDSGGTEGIDQRLASSVIGGVTKGVSALSGFISKRYGKDAGEFVGKALNDMFKEGTSEFIKNTIKNLPGTVLAGVGAGLAAIAAVSAVVVASIIGISAAIGGAIAKVIEFGVSLRMDREKTNAQLGGAESGTMARAAQVAATIGASTDDVARTMAKLQRQGFDMRGSGDLIQGMADLKLLNGDSGAGDALATAIAGIGDKNAGGVGQIEGLFGKNSKGAEVFKSNLAAITGASGSDKEVTAQIEAAIKAGKVTIAQAQGAALNALSAQTGKDVGGVAKTFSETTITGGIESLKNTVADLFNEFNQSPEVPQLFTRLKGLLDPSSESGKKLIAVGEKIFSIFGTALEFAINFDFEGALNEIVPTVRGILTVVGSIVEVVGSAGSAFLSAFLPVVSPLKSVFGALGGGASILTNLNGLFTALGAVAGVVVGVLVLAGGIVTAAWGVVAGAFGLVANNIAGVLGFIGTVVNAIQTGFDVNTLASDIGSSFVSIGTSITDGIWSGLTGAWGGLIGRIEGLTALLPASVRTVLGIASPSKVFREIGGYTMEGFTQGIDGAAPDVQAAVSGAIAPPPSFDGFAAEQTAQAASKGGAGVSIGAVNIEVHSSSADAKEVANETMALFLRWLEDTGTQVGAPALWVYLRPSVSQPFGILSSWASITFLARPR